MQAAFTYAFLGTNVGDVAVTKGAVLLARASGMLGAGSFISPKLNQGARLAWQRDIFRHLPYYKLVEWDMKALAQSGSPSDADIDYYTRPEILDEIGVNNARVFFYTGGEHLFSYHGRAGQDWDLLLRVAPLIAAKRSGKQTIVFPTTFGPFETPVSKEVLKKFVEASDILTVRDLYSARLVHELTGQFPNFALDAAFFIDPDFVKPLPVAATANLIMRLDKFGLRIGNDASKTHVEQLERLGYDQSNAYQLYRDIALNLLSMGIKIRIFIQCLADDAPARALHNELSSRFPETVELVKPVTPEEFISELGGGHVTVTSRFHGAIFSLLASRQAIAVYFDDHGSKIPGLFEGLEMNDYCINGTWQNAPPIVDLAVKVLQESGRHGTAISKRLGELRTETIEMLRSVVPQIEQADTLLEADVCKECGCALTPDESDTFGRFCQEHGLERIELEWSMHHAS